MFGIETLRQVTRKLSPRAQKVLVSAIIVALGLTAMIVGLSVGLSKNEPSSSHQSTKAEKSQENDEKDLTPKENFHNKTKGRNAPFDSQYHIYPSSAVTTDTNICSKYGSDVLRSGNGSVVDAAITTMLCVGIVNMQSTGIGGGFVATVYEKPRDQAEKVLTTILARERAPSAATRDMFANGTASSTVGGKAVAVPGEIRGYYEAWKEFGKMAWKDLFLPVIKLCEEGFYVERELANQIKSSEAYIRADPNFSELLVKEDGTLVQEGDLLINTKLGATMRRIADDPFTYYNGSLADDIIADLSEYGAIITKEDLIQYNASLKPAESVSISNGGFVLYNPPPPTSGVVLDFIVNILDGYNFTSEDISDNTSRVLAYHRLVEAFKFAYAKRSNLGDEDYVNVTELVRNLTSNSYAEEIRLQIDDNQTHGIEYYDPTFDIKPDAGTAHLNVVAQDGAAVAMTGTINLVFGAKVRGNRTGIMFNNEMDDFSTPGTFNAFGVPASPTNYIEPGKMPMSSMCPTLVFNNATGSLVLSSGASGGTRITTATALVTVASLWFDLDLKNATDTARVHHQLAPNEITYEPWLSQNIAIGLREKNHTMVQTSSKAVVGSVRKRCMEDECYYESISDGRKGGKPAGY